jgi:hypothetical protein
MQAVRKEKGLLVRQLDRRDLRGMSKTIPTEWMPRRAVEPEVAVEEPAAADGWSWGVVPPRSFEMDDDAGASTGVSEDVVGV